jgi:hypothetical protein
LLTLTPQNVALAEALEGTNEFMEVMVELYDECIGIYDFSFSPSS